MAVCSNVFSGVDNSDVCHKGKERSSLFIPKLKSDRAGQKMNECKVMKIASFK